MSVPVHPKLRAPVLSFIHPKNSATNSSFAAYFAGLVEGGGTIIVPERARSDKGRLYYPSCELSFHSRDVPLALLVQKEIGSGSLSKFTKKNAYNYAVKDFAGLLRVFHLLNGNLRTAPKLAQFTELAM